jgi:hypothetical protein
MQCIKRLWLEVNDRGKKAPMAPGLRYRLAVGADIGARARSHFGDGVLIDPDIWNPDERAERTRQAMAAGASTILEGTVGTGDLFVTVDALTRNEDGSWDITEVKSSTRVKRGHYYDVAIQVYAARSAALTVRKCRVMTINKDCAFPSLSCLFDVEDITSRVERLIDGIPKRLEDFRAALANAHEPHVVIGEQCTSPYDCPFKDYCWSDVGKLSIFDIPNLAPKRRRELRGRGIIHLRDIPPDYPLMRKQWVYVRRMLERRTYRRRQLAHRMLGQLEYPIHFLDFETDAPAVPRFDGFTPYANYPFQYSCHVLSEDGSLVHRDYLHTSESDPRQMLVESLITDVAPRGSVVVYYEPFERSVLESLAEAFPEHAAALDSIAAHLWDQLDVIRCCYKHHGFGNSNSLKSVLPVLVPELTYEDLAVRDGGDAQGVWNEMIRMKDGEGKARRIRELEDYCKLDTLAMVEIHKKLIEL